MSAEPPKDSVKECLTRAISEMVALYEEPRWQAWAQSWLSGQDRSEESAQVAFEFCVELAADLQDTRGQSPRHRTAAFEFFALFSTKATTDRGHGTNT